MVFDTNFPFRLSKSYGSIYFCRSHFQTGTTSIVWPSASICVW